MRLIELTRKVMLWFLVGLFALVAVCLVMYFLVLKPNADNIDPAKSPERELQVSKGGPRVSAGSPAVTGTVYLVPSSRIPETQEDRSEAAPVTLLADRWEESQDVDLQVGPTFDDADIAAPERAELMRAIGRFLNAWETFTPPLPEDAASAAVGYGRKLQPMVTPGGAERIIERLDNQQGGDVCPNHGCQVGSEWNDVDPAVSMRVRFYDGDSAYVTGFGSVVYADAGVNQTNLDGATFQRSYGLLLTRSGDRWLVDRAAAATNGQF